ncbi:hypothetical protein L2E82_15223 [Cichorium intybus]|uniref:Uncharacterized protein n=1 Tax=Cichorium intybus TaxID=13427 RepID=A0ACB9F289_CICIN|nr:hypothetical protein L2E82_15223 [Cichorium intybus]
MKTSDQIRNLGKDSKAEVPINKGGDSSTVRTENLQPPIDITRALRIADDLPVNSFNSSSSSSRERDGVVVPVWSPSNSNFTKTFVDSKRKDETTTIVETLLTSPASLLRRIHRPTSRTFRPPLVSQRPLRPTTVGFSNSQPTHREPSTSRRVHRHPAPSHQQTSAAATVYAFYGEHHNKPDATTITAGSHRTSHQPLQLRPGLEWKGTESKMLNNTSMYLQVLSGIPEMLLLLVLWGQKTMVEKLAYSSEIQEMTLLFLAFSLLEYEKELKPKFVSLTPNVLLDDESKLSDYGLARQGAVEFTFTLGCTWFD